MEIKTILKERKKGVSTFLMLLVGVFLLCIVLYSTTIPLEKMALHSQLMDVGRGAMFRVEAEGGLSQDTERLIKDKLVAKGLDKDLISIECNSKVDPSNPTHTPTYGEDVTLIIKYNYKYTTKKVNGFTVSNGDEKTEMLQYKTSSTAKN